MKSLILAVAVGMAGTLLARAEHSTLPPRAEQLFGHMKMATGQPDRITAEASGPAARSPIFRERRALGTAERNPDLLKRPIYTGRNPFTSPAQQPAVAAMTAGRECQPGGAKQCCAN
jgi:hypothetical protein